MVKVPTYYAKRVPSAIPEEAPISIRAARTGAEEAYRGMEAFGKGLMGLGQTLALTEIQKQRLRDSTALTSAGGDIDKFVYDESNIAKRKEYKSTEEIQADRESFSQRYDEEIERLARAMSPKAAMSLRASSKKFKVSDLKQMEREWWKAEIDLEQSDTQRMLSNRFQKLAERGFSAETILKDPLISGILEDMRPYFKEGNIEFVRDDTLVTVLSSLGRFDDARKYVKESKIFTAQEKEVQLKKINGVRNRRAADLVEGRELYESQILADILEGKKAVAEFEQLFIDSLRPDVTGVTRLTPEQVRSLRTVLYAPKLKSSKLDALFTMEDVTSKVGRGLMNTRDALTILTETAPNLTPSDTKSYLGQIYKKVDALREEVIDSAEKRGRAIIDKRASALVLDPSEEDAVRRKLADRFSVSLKTALREKDVPIEKIDEFTDNLASSMEVSREAVMRIVETEELRLLKKEEKTKEDLLREAKAAKARGQDEELKRILKEMLDRGLITLGELGEEQPRKRKKKSKIGTAFENIRKAL